METELTAIKTVRTYEADSTCLKVIDTPDAIVATTESHDISEITSQISRIDFAISEWQAKRKPLQDILDKYNEIKPVIKEEEDGLEDVIG